MPTLARLEERAAGVVARSPLGDLQCAHVIAEQLHLLQTEVDSGLVVVAQPFRSGRLLGAEWRGKAHVAVQRFGREVAQRGQTRLEAETTNAPILQAVEPATGRARTPRGELRQPLDVGVRDRFEV